jgi:hypothetical protein
VSGSGSRVWVLGIYFTAYSQYNTHRAPHQVYGVVHIQSIQEVIQGTEGSAWWAPAWSMLAVGGIYSANGGTKSKKSVLRYFLK